MQDRTKYPQLRGFHDVGTVSGAFQLWPHHLRHLRGGLHPAVCQSGPDQHPGPGADFRTPRRGRNSGHVPADLCPDVLPGHGCGGAVHPGGQPRRKSDYNRGGAVQPDSAGSGPGNDSVLVPGQAALQIYGAGVPDS